MAFESLPGKKSIFRNPLFYSTCILLASILYVASIFVSRWQESRAFNQKMQKEKLEYQRDQDRATLQQLGGTELAIQMFYAAPPVIHRGETAQLCYGVANAKTVVLEPKVGAVWPSYSRCVDVSPSKTTTYVLTATAASGASTSQSVTLRVL